MEPKFKLKTKIPLPPEIQEELNQVQKDIAALETVSTKIPFSPLDEFDTWRMMRSKERRRRLRLPLVWFAIWSLFVFVRSSGSYEILGIDFYSWDEDQLLVNWLVVPAVVAGIYFGVMWAIGKKAPQTPLVTPKTQLFNNFKDTISSWPPSERLAAIRFLNVVLANRRDLLDVASVTLSSQQKKVVLDLVLNLNALSKKR